MSKFHVGDKVRLVDRDGLFEQFFLTEGNGFDSGQVYTVEEVDTEAGAGYGYDGSTYLVVSEVEETWDVPVDVMRPADIFAWAFEPGKTVHLVKRTGDEEPKEGDKIEIHSYVVGEPDTKMDPDLTLHEENLIWHAQTQSLPLKDLDEWIKAVSKMLWAIRTGQGVELELPATPHVPYLDN